jgi:uncharacterized membrane protein YccF (DUF307 family)
MKTFGNVLWVVISGIWSAIGWLFWALVLGLTVVGLPFARQCLKLARLTLWPFGRTTVKSPTASSFGVIGNILWFIPGALMALLYVLQGLVLCLTVIGIPFGIQAFKFAGLALSPFGREVVKSSEVTSVLASSREATA